jgi:hypothetical protein
MQLLEIFFGQVYLAIGSVICHVYAAENARKQKEKNVP